MIEAPCSFGFWDLPEDVSPYHGLLATNTVGQCLDYYSPSKEESILELAPCAGGPRQLWSVAVGAHDDPAAYSQMYNPTLTGCVSSDPVNSLYVIAGTCHESYFDSKKWLLVTG